MQSNSSVTLLKIGYMEQQLAPFSIYAESTPNPATMKFVANRYLIVSDNTFEFPLGSSTANSPLAERLLQFPFINTVFFAKNFITLTKVEAIEWQDVIQELRVFIGDYLNKGGMVVKADEAVKESETAGGTQQVTRSDHKAPENDLEEKIISILDEYIKPAVESDGGAIVFDSYAEGTVNVVLKGSCSGCPSSTMTLKAGIEGLLKQMLPEDVQQVEAVNG
jgi:Fe-S cluster biogenesis protein NfuA